MFKSKSNYARAHRYVIELQSKAEKLRRGVINWPGLANQYKENWHIFMVVFRPKNWCVFNVPHRIWREGGTEGRGWNDVGGGCLWTREHMFPASLSTERFSPHLEVVYFPSTYVRAAFVTCFDHQCNERTFWDFGFQALRGLKPLASSRLGLGCQTLRQARVLIRSRAEWGVGREGHLGWGAQPSSRLNAKQEWAAPENWPNSASPGNQEK